LRIPFLPADCTVVEAALAYADAGIYVGPVAHGTKHPGSVLGKDWHHQTSRDPEVIRGWFDGTDHGIFLHCGRSGLVVFDVDHPDAMPDVLSTAIRRKHPPYQSTRTNQPGRGHYFFRVPDGRRLGNSRGKLSRNWGEIRGQNGVIVVFPSEHEMAGQGGWYRWGCDGVVPVLPDEVAELLPDADEAADAATDEVVASFLAEHQEESRRDLLGGVKATFDRKVAEGESRHESAVEVTCWAMREAAAGLYPAERAAGQIGEVFIEAMAQSRGWSDRVLSESQAAAEFDSILAWAIGQVDKADLDEVRRAARQRRPLSGEGRVKSSPRSEPPDDDEEESDERAGERRDYNESGNGNQGDGARSGRRKPAWAERLIDGKTWLITGPERIEPLWGDDECILAARGQPTIIAGASGSAKTTIVQRLALGAMGVEGFEELLGLPVVQTKGKVLFLAADRPEQARQSMRRMVISFDAWDAVEERLVVMTGPPPDDIAEDDKILRKMAREAEATLVIPDSLKDFAVDLSKEGVGARVNSAFQYLIADEVDVIVPHHPRKIGRQDKSSEVHLDDLFGSAHIFNGAGSVLYLERAPTDFELTQLKSPNGEYASRRFTVGLSDGSVELGEGDPVLDTVRKAGGDGMSTVEVARVVLDKESPTEADIEKIRRRLKKLEGQQRVAQEGAGRNSRWKAM
jgi:hypothetical protein